MINDDKKPQNFGVNDENDAEDDFIIDKNLVVVIAGPTAVGKSDVAAQLCANLKGVIVSADSVQAYRGVEIGANKPNCEERKMTPHILVDVADYNENYNAAEWRGDAISAIQELLLEQNPKTNNNNEEEMMDGATTRTNYKNNNNNRRHRNVITAVEEARLEKGYSKSEPLLPVVCGGTMMYIQWLVHGHPDAVCPSPLAVEQAQTTMSHFQENNNFEGALAHVQSFGQVFATRTATLSGEDWYRLRRILEVALTVQEKGEEEENGKEIMIEKLYTGQRQGSLASMGYDVRCFFLCPDDRMNHTRIIDERCERMVSRGLLKETAGLSLSGCMPEMAARAIGYRQALEYLNAETITKNLNDRVELFHLFLNNFSTATRRYAKKQMSWFRKDDQFVFIPVALTLDKAQRIQESATCIERFLKMTRYEYDKMLHSKDSTSTKLKKKNEEQAKEMKFYQLDRRILKKGSKPFEDAFSEAEQLRESMRGKIRRIEEQSQ